jgi:hypothetical protein
MRISPCGCCRAEAAPKGFNHRPVFLANPARHSESRGHEYLELIVAGDHRPLRPGRAYRLEPVTEDAGDGGLVLMGYQVFDADSDEFILYLDSEDVQVSEA